MIRNALKSLFVFAAAFGVSLFLFNEYRTYSEAAADARRAIDEVAQYQAAQREALRVLRKDAQAIIDRIDFLEGRVPAAPASAAPASATSYASFR